MKKIICAVISVLSAPMFLFGGASRAVALEKEPACKAAYCCDYGTGTAIYAKEETKRLPIASMCKIMTLLLSFEAADRGELSYDEMITVSENAAGMGGSQVFLQAGLSYSAEELLKTIAVCSANDSCVAMAERVAGSESAFIERMNARAKELGAENTLFANCTGLPKEPQYSCAKDVAAMLRELLKHEKYYTLTKIWMEDFAHPDGRTTQISNTNKLLRYYDGCDGGKTGFTSEAGYCLAATAKRGDTRIISVVIGAESSKIRNAAVSALLDEAFQNYENKVLLKAGETVGERAEVRGSRVETVAVAAKDALTAFGKRGENGKYHVEIRLGELRAPVSSGDDVGEAVLYNDGVEISRVGLVATEDAPSYTWWDALRESAKNWN